MTDIAIWVVQGLLALAMLAAGTMKAATPRDRLMARMEWVGRFPPLVPRLIGIAEVAGAIGLVAPQALDVLPVLTPVAGACLAVLMAGAVKVHLDEGRPLRGIVPGVFGLLALVVAIGRGAGLA